MTKDPPDLSNSPLYWLAVLAAARRSRDRLLEEYARQQLRCLKVRVIFAKELPDTPAAKGEYVSHRHGPPSVVWCRGRAGGRRW